MVRITQVISSNDFFYKNGGFYLEVV